MKALVGFQSVQASENGELTTGSLCVDDEGQVFFLPEDEDLRPASEKPNEAVKGSLGEFEEVEEPVPTE